MRNSSKAITKFLNDKSGQRYVIGYKVVLKSFRGCIVGPYRAGYYYKIGENKSNCRKRTKGYYRDNNKRISHGIHVLLSEEAAEQLIREEFYVGHASLKIIRVRCYLGDLLGVSENGSRAVFRSIYISENEFRKALK